MQLHHACMWLCYELNMNRLIYVQIVLTRLWLIFIYHAANEDVRGAWK